MKVLLIIIAFTAIAAIDVPDMTKNKKWRELIIYSVIFLLIFALGVAVALDVKIPSPIKAIQAFYRDVLGLSFKPS